MDYERDIIAKTLAALTYKDIVIIVALGGIFFILYFDYSIFQKFEHFKYLIIFTAGVACMGYIMARANETAAATPKPNQTRINTDFDPIIDAISALRAIPDLNAKIDSIEKNISRFVQIYHKSQDRNPAFKCGGNFDAPVYDEIKDAKKAKEKIIRDFNKILLASDGENYEDKVRYQLGRAEVTLNAYLRQIHTICNTKGGKRRSLLDSTTFQDVEVY